MFFRNDCNAGEKQILYLRRPFRVRSYRLNDRLRGGYEFPIFWKTEKDYRNVEFNGIYGNV